MQTLVSLYPFQCLLLSVLLIIAILLGLKWYFIVVFKKYLFILIFTFFGYVGLSCITQDLWYGAQAPECIGPIIVVHRLSCPTACGILVPRPELKHAFPAL